MITSIKGEILYIGKDFSEILGGSIAYKVFCPSKVLGGLKEGDSKLLFTHLHIRENAHELYGFNTRKERDFFVVLIGISGIGPKGGMSVIESAPLETLKQAIASGDTSVLTRVSGIGQKTAQRIIIELKGKLEDLSDEASEGLRQGGDVIDALVSLGYSRAQAQSAFSAVGKNIEGVENKIKEALKHLGK
jgi:holliday junction DNA helicase RuvA